MDRSGLLAARLKGSRRIGAQNRGEGTGDNERMLVLPGPSEAGGVVREPSMSTQAQRSESASTDGDAQSQRERPSLWR